VGFATVERFEHDPSESLRNPTLRAGWKIRTTNLPALTLQRSRAEVS